MEKMMVTVYVFCVGCCIGSFVNVVIYRMPLGKNVVKGRSFCLTCAHQLSGFDLVPIFSWLLLKGKCRYCHSPISPSYAWIELISGLFGVCCLYRFGWGFDCWLYFAVGEGLLALSVIDYHTLLIPDQLNAWLWLLAFCHFLLYPTTSLFSRLLGMLAVSLPMYLINLLIKESFGGGDIKLMSAAGFLLGGRLSMLAGLLAVLSGGVAALGIMIVKKKHRKSYMAFGPFLSLGIVISIFFGEQILYLYWLWMNWPCSFQ